MPSSSSFVCGSPPQTPSTHTVSSFGSSSPTRPFANTITFYKIGARHATAAFVGLGCNLVDLASDPQCREPVKKLGAMCWLSLALCVVETLISVKFGRGEQREQRAQGGSRGCLKKSSGSFAILGFRFVSQAHAPSYLLDVGNYCNHFVDGVACLVRPTIPEGNSSSTRQESAINVPITKMSLSLVKRTTEWGLLKK